MIFKNIVSTVIFCTYLVNNVSGASYSRVFVQRGSDVQPYQYYNYGAPEADYAGSQLARLSAAPVGSVLPLPQAASFIPSCVSPCVPSQSVAPIVNAGLVAYNAPSVVVTREEPASYQYSYLVYDPSTGDHKAVNELSDEGLVTGQYSLLQPDGYVREVQYTADDISGFNAVVRRFLPEVGVRNVNLKKSKYCADCQHAALKNQPDGEHGHGETHDIDEEPVHGEHGHIETSLHSPQGEAPAHEEHGLSADGEREHDETPSHGLHEDAPAHENSKTNSLGTPPHADTASHTKLHKETPAHEEHDKLPSKEEHGHPPDHGEAPPTNHGSREEEKESHKPHSKPSIVKEEPSKPTEHVQETLNKQIEHAKVKPENPHEQHTEYAQVEILPQGVIIANPPPISFTTYSQLMKCIQAMKNGDQRINSPLSYILLPSSPC